MCHYLLPSSFKLISNLSLIDFVGITLAQGLFTFYLHYLQKNETGVKLKKNGKECQQNRKNDFF